MSPQVLIPAVFGIIFVSGLLYVISKKPEKSSLLTGIGITGTFVIGLLFVMLVPSFNENWSPNTAKSLTLYHNVYDISNGWKNARQLAPGEALRPDGVYAGYTPQQAHGRRVYQREGCMYCHSQQIRPLAGEIKRYSIGSSMAPQADEREYVFDQPHYLGTRRIGPDLSRVGGKYSDDWHYSHFYYPRQMVTGSIMPAFTWMFDDTDKNNPIPKPDMVDLVAYVQTLGFERLVYDPNLNGPGQGGYRSWLSPRDQQYSQRLGVTQVLNAAQPVRGAVQKTPANAVATPPITPARKL